VGTLLVAQLVMALRYKPKGRSSIPDGVIEILNDKFLPIVLWPWG